MRSVIATPESSLYTPAGTIKRAPSGVALIAAWNAADDHGASGVQPRERMWCCDDETAGDCRLFETHCLNIRQRHTDAIQNLVEKLFGTAGDPANDLRTRPRHEATAFQNY